MLFIIVKEWKFCCIRFRFVLWSRKINSFLLFNFFSFSPGKEKIIISCFLTSYTHQVEFFLLIFFNIWPFIYWTLNKQSLETWSFVCCCCTYGLFLGFRSLWNISKKTPGNLSGMGRGQFYARVNGIKKLEKKKQEKCNLLHHQI